MELRLIYNQEAWDLFVSKHGPRSGAFLQSWAWGEFQVAAGRQVRRFGWEEEGRLVAAAQTVVHRLPTYAYIPRGPVTLRAWSNEETMARLRDLGGLLRAVFVRFEPPWPQYPMRKRFVKTIDMQPAHTLIMDLGVSSEARRTVMHPKTRYNIRLAERKGVEIEVRASAAFEEVWSLFETTAARGKFHLHPKRYYETMLSMLADGPCRAFLAVARFDGKIIAANLMVDEGKTRTYLHGASGDDDREVMAPYLLHGKLMEDAAERGLEAYDWWGIAPEGAEDHPWAGVTRFKLGFGGERVSYPGAFDAVIHPTRYGIYVLARRVRRLA